MNFAGINENDVADCDDGLCVSLWFQGCPHHCPFCHSSSTWDVNCGSIINNDDVVERLSEMIAEDGIMRNLSILGGEPLAEYNRADCYYIISNIRKMFPNIKIYLWTGYTKEELDSMRDIIIEGIFCYINVLIDGRYVHELRDTSLRLRGSSNQKVYVLR